MTTMYAGRTLGVPGVDSIAILKGDALDVLTIFRDEDGVECADAKLTYPPFARYSVPVTYLRKTPPADIPPQQELSTSTNARKGGISPKRGRRAQS